jgi:hypothetical protein
MAPASALILCPPIADDRSSESLDAIVNGVYRELVVQCLSGDQGGEHRCVASSIELPTDPGRRGVVCTVEIPSRLNQRRRTDSRVLPTHPAVGTKLSDDVPAQVQPMWLPLARLMAKMPSPPPGERMMDCVR